MWQKLWFVMLLTSSYAWAGCDRETVDFYLKKGFNQEQITQLCAQSTPTAPSYQPYQKPVVIVKQGYMPGMSEEESRAIRTLKGSIDARSVDVTDTKINYISKLCMRVGNSPEKEQRMTKCVDVAYSISRENLKVRESGGGMMFFGRESITVSSEKVLRKLTIKDPWSSMPPDLALNLKRKYESLNNPTKIDVPLRRGAAPHEVIDAIRTLSSVTARTNIGSEESEVEKILSEDYVPPTEEEYVASQPTYEEEKQIEKKNKKWWNPFD